MQLSPETKRFDAQKTIRYNHLINQQKELIMNKNHPKKTLGIFGGTYEGRLLAEFCQKNEIPAVISVATSYGSQLLEGKVSTGRMNADEMTKWIKQQNISAVIDATHPFAQDASRQIRLACTTAQIEYLRLIRPQAHQTPKPPAETQNPRNLSWVSSAKEAAALLKKELLQHPERTALLTTGSKDLSYFTAEKALLPQLFVRVLPSVEAIQACQAAGIDGKHILALQGPFSLELNQALIHTVQASYLVTKESGQAGGFQEKLNAARLCGCQVIAIRRPREEVEGKSLEEIKQWLDSWKKKPTPRHALHNDPISLQIVLLGIGMGNPAQITWEGIQALGKADALLGASRMVETGKALCRQFFAQIPVQQQQDWNPHKQERITYKKEEMLSWLKEHPEIRRPVLLFSGDTGFYSGAKSVLELLQMHYPPSALHLLPGISSLSCFAAKIGHSWENAEHLSFHGRESKIDWSLSDGKEKFFLLDGTQRLHQICRHLIAHGQSGATVWVGENLSYAEERIFKQKPEALLSMEFQPLLAAWVIPDA